MQCRSRCALPLALSPQPVGGPGSTFLTVPRVSIRSTSALTCGRFSSRSSSRTTSGNTSPAPPSHPTRQSTSGSPLLSPMLTRPTGDPCSLAWRTRRKAEKVASDEPATRSCDEVETRCSERRRVRGSSDSPKKMTRCEQEREKEESVAVEREGLEEADEEERAHAPASWARRTRRTPAP